MTPATREDADESKSTRREVAEASAEGCKPGARRPLAAAGRGVRTMGLRMQARDQAAGSAGRLGRRPGQGQGTTAQVRRGGGGGALADLESGRAAGRKTAGGEAGAGLPHYDATPGKLRHQVKAATLAISAAQIDRLLAPRKARTGAKGRCGTKPGGLRKHHLPIRTDHWDSTRPGFWRQTRWRIAGLR